MGELATLLTAIGGLVTALGGAAAVIITALRTSRRERNRAADTVLDELHAAAEDGRITPEELAAILRKRAKEDEQ